MREIGKFFLTSNCINVFKIKGSLVSTLKKNNTLIELSLSKILRKFKKDIKIKIEQIIKNISNLNFASSLE